MDIHLHGKKTTVFFVLNGLLVLLVFFAGWLSGVMMTSPTPGEQTAASRTGRSSQDRPRLKLSDLTSAQQTAARLKSESGQFKRQPMQSAALQARKEQPQATLGRTDTPEETSSAAVPEQPEPAPSQQTEAQPPPQPAPEAASQEKTTEEAAENQTNSSEVKPQPSPAVKESPGPHPESVYLLQVGSYLVKNNAFNTLEALEDKGYAPFIHKLSDTRGQNWYVLYAGSYPNATQARQAAQAYKKQEESMAVVKTVPAPVFERRQKHSEVITRPNNKDQPKIEAESGQEAPKDRQERNSTE